VERLTRIIWKYVGYIPRMVLLFLAKRPKPAGASSALLKKFLQLILLKVKKIAVST
jgi:hypothetical protein